MIEIFNKFNERCADIAYKRLLSGIKIITGLCISGSRNRPYIFFFALLCAKKLLNLPTHHSQHILRIKTMAKRFNYMCRGKHTHSHRRFAYTLNWISCHYFLYQRVCVFHSESAAVPLLSYQPLEVQRHICDVLLLLFCIHTNATKSHWHFFYFQTHTLYVHHIF